jgi:hypothetical protein
MKSKKTISQAPKVVSRDFKISNRHVGSRKSAALYEYELGRFDLVAKQEMPVGNPVPKCDVLAGAQHAFSDTFPGLFIAGRERYC